MARKDKNPCDGGEKGDNPRKNLKKTGQAKNPCGGEKGTPHHGGQSKKGLEKDRPSQEPVWWGGGDTTWGTIQEGIGRRHANI